MGLSWESEVLLSSVLAMQTLQNIAYLQVWAIGCQIVRKLAQFSLKSTLFFGGLLIAGLQKSLERRQNVPTTAANETSRSRANEFNRLKVEFSENID